jgi:hypothetical protein
MGRSGAIHPTGHIGPSQWGQGARRVCPRRGRRTSEPGSARVKTSREMKSCGSEDGRSVRRARGSPAGHRTTRRRSPRRNGCVAAVDAGMVRSDRGRAKRAEGASALGQTKTARLWEIPVVRCRPLGIGNWELGDGGWVVGFSTGGATEQAAEVLYQPQPALARHPKLVQKRRQFGWPVRAVAWVELAPRPV